jgi:hypothetical protein
MKYALGAIIGVAGIAATASGQAFDDRGMFEDAAIDRNIPLTGFESFEDAVPDPLDFLDEVEGENLTVTGFDTFDGFESIFTIETQAQSGLVPTDGDQLLRVSTFDGSEVTITFDVPVTAVGFNVIGAGNFGGPGSVVAQTDTGILLDIIVADNDVNETFFAGVITNQTFNSITIFNTFDGDSYGIDAVAFGVPAPGAGAVLAMAGLAMTRRRR